MHCGLGPHVKMCGLQVSQRVSQVRQVAWLHRVRQVAHVAWPHRVAHVTHVA